MVKALVKRIFRINWVYTSRISPAPQSQRQATALQKEMADTPHQMRKRKAWRSSIAEKLPTYALQALNSAFAQQHLRLLENDTLAFETDLTVLNSLLKTDGFKQYSGRACPAPTENEE